MCLGGWLEVRQTSPSESTRDFESSRGAKRPRSPSSRKGKWAAWQTVETLRYDTAPYAKLRADMLAARDERILLDSGSGVHLYSQSAARPRVDLTPHGSTVSQAVCMDGNRCSKARAGLAFAARSLAESTQRRLWYHLAFPPLLSHSFPSSASHSFFHSSFHLPLILLSLYLSLVHRKISTKSHCRKDPLPFRPQAPSPPNSLLPVVLCCGASASHRCYQKKQNPKKIFFRRLLPYYISSRSIARRSFVGFA
ncbi:hypothetical protein VTO42DRAFT_5276 [Malbranchea cinnamomea]